MGQGTSGRSPSPRLPQGRVLPLSHLPWAGWGLLLPSRVGCEAMKEEYWLARLQGGRGDRQLRGVGWEPHFPEGEAAGEPQGEGERSQKIKEESQLGVHGKEWQPQGQRAQAQWTGVREGAQRPFAASPGLTRRAQQTDSREARETVVGLQVDVTIVRTQKRWNT